MPCFVILAFFHCPNFDTIAPGQNLVSTPSTKKQSAEKFRSWRHSESFSALCHALNNPDRQCPITDEYVDRLLQLMDIVDEAVLTLTDT